MIPCQFSCSLLAPFIELTLTVPISNFSYTHTLTRVISWSLVPPVPELGKTHHGADGPRQHGALRKVAGGVRVRPQRDHGAHVQVSRPQPPLPPFGPKVTELNCDVAPQVPVWPLAGQRSGRRQPGEDIGGGADDAQHREWRAHVSDAAHATVPGDDEEVCDHFAKQQTKWVSKTPVRLTSSHWLFFFHYYNLFEVTYTSKARLNKQTRDVFSIPWILSKHFCGLPSFLPLAELNTGQIQEGVGEAINGIVKHFHKPEKEVRDGRLDKPQRELLLFIANQESWLFCSGGLQTHWAAARHQRSSPTSRNKGEHL